MPAASQASERLEKAKACYKGGSLVEASHHFKTVSDGETCSTLSPLLTPIAQVAKSCSCQTGNPNVECTCADFLAACRDRTLDAILRTSCKCPRRAQKRCKDESHLTALGSLVMVAVKAKDYKLGLVYAQNLIHLSPRDPRGYLRVGQVLRLMEKQHTALAVYQQGVGLVTRANAEHPGLRALREQEKITRKLTTQVDPLEALPAEILVLVLSYLNTRHHCQCIRLSKSWRAFMESQVARPLWTSQHFGQLTKSAKTIKPNMVQRYLVKYPNGQLKSLRIDNCNTLPLACGKIMSILRACPQLQHLSLGGAAQIEVGGPVDMERELHKLPKLQSLHLGSEISIPAEILDCMINASCQTLQELNVYKLPFRQYYPNMSRTINWRHLPKLRTLRLSGWDLGHRVNMNYIADVTPNVETVWMDRMFYTERSLYERPPATLPRWPKLRRLFVGSNVTFAQNIDFPVLPGDMEELVIEGFSPMQRVFSRMPAETAETAGQSVQMYDATGPASAMEMPIYEFPKLRRVVLKSKRKCSLKLIMGDSME